MNTPSSTLECRSSASRKQDIKDRSKLFLPPPPDIRKVVFHPEETVANIRATPDSGLQPSVIANANTTIIGDYSSVVFLDKEQHWLVQAQGNATYSSVIALIKQGLIQVDRRYIFVQLGGNHIRSAKKSKVYMQVVQLIQAIRRIRADSRIFLVAVLPRMQDDKEAKPYIIKFNKWLATSVQEADKLFGKVKFLPVQLRFILQGAPNQQFFDMKNPLLLNQEGAAMLKMELFKLAGFAKNS